MPGIVSESHLIAAPRMPQSSHDRLLPRRVRAWIRAKWRRVPVLARKAVRAQLPGRLTFICRVHVAAQRCNEVAEPNPHQRLHHAATPHALNRPLTARSSAPINASYIHMYQKFFSCSIFFQRLSIRLDCSVRRGETCPPLDDSLHIASSGRIAAVDDSPHSSRACPGPQLSTAPPLSMLTAALILVECAFLIAAWSCHRQHARRSGRRRM